MVLEELGWVCGGREGWGSLYPLSGLFISQARREAAAHPRAWRVSACMLILAHLAASLALKNEFAWDYAALSENPLLRRSWGLEVGILAPLPLGTPLPPSPGCTHLYQVYF